MGLECDEDGLASHWLDVYVPSDLPMMTFPEISMWGLFPWGGWDATALPERLCKLYAQLNGKALGCTLYSEGLYEDFNKAAAEQAKLVVGNEHGFRSTNWGDAAAEQAPGPEGLPGALPALPLQREDDGRPLQLPRAPDVPVTRK